MTSTPIFNKDRQCYRTNQDQLNRNENCKSNKESKGRVEKSENGVKNSDENGLFKYVQGAETLHFKFLSSKRVEVLS